MDKLLKIFMETVKRHRKHTVFSDLCQITAISIRNSVDKKGWEEREEHYLRTIKKYNKKEVDLIAELIALVVIELERNPRDVLGEMYMKSATNSSELGQFYTPKGISELMASITFDKKNIHKEIGKGNLIKIMEPTVGGGTFPIAYVELIKKAGHDPANTTFIHGTDIDIVAVHMAYIQFSLLGIPGLVIHGNPLTNEVWDIWPTPFYLLNPLINMKLRRKEVKEINFNQEDRQLMMM